MDFLSLQTEIRLSRPAPVYFFYGGEPYWIDRLVGLLLGMIEPVARDFDCDMLSGEEVEGWEVVSRARAFPMMAQRRLVLVKQIHCFSEKDRTRILHYIDDPSESTCLVLIGGEIEPRQKFYQALIRSTHAFESKPLYPNQAVDWVIARFRELGRKITPEAATFLVDEVGTSLWALHHEIEKIVTFMPETDPIPLETVSAVAGFSRAYSVWELADAVGRRDLGMAIRILERLMALRQSPAYVLVDLTRRIELMLRIRIRLDRGDPKERIIRELGLRPFLATAWIEQARQFTQETLLGALRSLLAADVVIKTGRLDARLALTLVLFDLIERKGEKRFFKDSQRNLSGARVVR